MIAFTENYFYLNWDRDVHHSPKKYQSKLREYRALSRGFPLATLRIIRDRARKGFEECFLCPPTKVRLRGDFPWLHKKAIWINGGLSAYSLMNLTKRRTPLATDGQRSFDEGGPLISDSWQML